MLFKIQKAVYVSAVKNHINPIAVKSLSFAIW